MTTFLRLIRIAPIFVGILGISPEIGCRNEKGEIVDWFYLYKLPHNKEKAHASNFDGLSYAFLSSSDSFSLNPDWTLSELKVNDSRSFPGQTIVPLYSSERPKLALFYNDEPPNGKTDFVKGHTKGVLAAGSVDGKIQGFWLVHSVPHFPPELDAKSYEYPSTGRIYGQSFLCITLNASQLDRVGQQLLFNEPLIYSFHLDDELKAALPNVQKVLNNETVKAAPFWSNLALQSVGGQEFVSFAKSKDFGKELYADLIAPTLNSDLSVETWRHGPGNLNSSCDKPFRVYNVRSVNIEKVEDEFSSLKDHSKWAVSTTSKDNWICVGDINRQEHQEQRGGGSVCQSSTMISNIYRKTIGDIEPCRPNRLRYSHWFTLAQI